MFYPRYSGCPVHPLRFSSPFPSGNPSFAEHLSVCLSVYLCVCPSDCLCLPVRSSDRLYECVCLVLILLLVQSSQRPTPICLSSLNSTLSLVQSNSYTCLSSLNIALSLVSSSSYSCVSSLNIVLSLSLVKFLLLYVCPCLVLIVILVQP